MGETCGRHGSQHNDNSKRAKRNGTTAEEKSPCSSKASLVLVASRHQSQGGNGFIYHQQQETANDAASTPRRATAIMTPNPEGMCRYTTSPRSQPIIIRSVRLRLRRKYWAMPNLWVWQVHWSTTMKRTSRTSTLPRLVVPSFCVSACCRRRHATYCRQYQCML